MTIVVGIDEVGRGPLAGPVTVCAVFCEENTYNHLKKSKSLPILGKDSKKLTETERNTYNRILNKLKKEKKIFFKITHVSNSIIDKKGISFAIRSALKKSILSFKTNPKTVRVMLDGGLKAPGEFLNQKTIIKGDEKEKIIAWASILAKVSRDKLMRTAHQKFSHYDFHINKGYGTASHRMAINKYGISSFHRLSFCKNFIDL